METGRGGAKPNKKAPKILNKMQENEGKIRSAQSGCAEKKFSEKIKKVEIKWKIQKETKKNRKIKMKGEAKHMQNAQKETAQTVEKERHIKAASGCSVSESLKPMK